MTALAETDVVANELERVVPKLARAFEREDTFYSTIEKKNVEVVSNRDVRVPIELRPGGSFGHFNPAGGDLGRGTGPEFDKAVVNVQHFKYAVEYQRKAEWATDSSRKAILNTVQHLLAKAMPEFRRHVDSLCMTSGNGVLATVSAVTNDATNDTITCKTSGDGFGVRLLRYKQPIAVFDSTLATNRTTGTDKTINYYSLSANQIKYAAAAQLAQVGDKLVVGGLGNVTGSSVVSLYGVQYHHSSSTSGSWLGFTKSSTPEVVGNSVAASGSFALPFFRLALNKAGDRVGMDQVGQVAAWMHPCQQQAYEETAQAVSIIQKQARDESLNMYFGGSMQLAGAPVKTHFSWDKTRVDFVNSSLFGRCEMNPASFFEVQGKRLFETRNTSTGGVEASIVFYIVASMQLFHVNPAASTYVSGLTIPTGYVV